MPYIIKIYLGKSIESKPHKSSLFLSSLATPAAENLKHFSLQPLQKDNQSDTATDNRKIKAS